VIAWRSRAGLNEVPDPEIAPELARLATLDIAAAVVRTRRQAADLAVRDRERATTVALLRVADEPAMDRAA
jgi:hypothetical protein